MKLAALLGSIEAVSVQHPADVDVAGVTCDSRQVRPGSVFVAIPGAKQDGWQYAEAAAERGAVAVVSEGAAPLTRHVCQVRVADAHLALAQLAAAFHRRPADRLQVVGITGTNGKTTTAYMTRDILQAEGRAPGLISTVEYRLGERAIPASRTTPDAPTLQDLLARMEAAGCHSVVMEVSSHALVQKRTAGIDFDVAVFTNLTQDHLDYHRTLESYFEAKALLFERLGRGAKRATAAININDPWGRRLAARRDLAATVLTFGVDAEGADVCASNVVLGRDGSRFDVRTPWGRTSLRIQLLGRYNVSNALGALAAGGALGLPLDRMAAVFAGVGRVPGRLEPVETGRGFQVFVDYAHTDDALENVLRTLRELGPSRLLVVFGCGGDRDRTKRAKMGAVAARLADHAILTSDNPRSENPAAIIAQIRDGFGASANVETVEDRAQAIRRALDLAREGDIVLIAGKGHENFQEFANTTVSFDDRQVVRRLL